MASRFSDTVNYSCYKNKLSYFPDPKAYDNETTRLNTEFRHDLAEFYGMNGHPKEAALFEIAFGICSYGFTDNNNFYENIASRYERLMELLK